MNKIGHNHLKKRYFFDKLFKLLGIAAISLSIMILTFMVCSIIYKGYKAFEIVEIKLPLYFEDGLTYKNNYNQIIENSFAQYFNCSDKSIIYNIVSEGSIFALKKLISENKHYINQKKDVWLITSARFKQNHQNKSAFSVSEQMIYDNLQKNHKIREKFNFNFFISTDSREAEIAGIGGSIIGTLLVILISILVAAPVAIATAIYLEEFAPNNKWTHLVEININNLAAVPSIVFGLLGLALFIGLLNIPRSSAMVGGLTLALMVLPTIIITTRNSLKSIPDSMRQAVMALGASDVQLLVHHTLPLAMPGIVTGIILSISRIIGETAPLIMIGMVAFMTDYPTNIYSPASVLPVQIYLWSDSPELGFAENTEAAILVLILLLSVINLGATLIRKRFEVKW